MFFYFIFFLITNDIKHLFMCLLAIGMAFVFVAFEIPYLD